MYGADPRGGPGPVRAPRRPPGSAPGRSRPSSGGRSGRPTPLHRTSRTPGCGCPVGISSSGRSPSSSGSTATPASSPGRRRSPSGISGERSAAGCSGGGRGRAAQSVPPRSEGSLSITERTRNSGRVGTYAEHPSSDCRSEASVLDLVLVRAEERRRRLSNRHTRRRGQSANEKCSRVGGIARTSSPLRPLRRPGPVGRPEVAGVARIAPQ